MNRRSVLLSFCITTRNRESYIGATLENLVSQATDEVEIVVLDAASTDGTRETVEGFARRFPRLRYFRQETNEGVDRDYDRTVELAEAEYCWMMSDDDALAPGAVAEVLGHCREGFDLIVVMRKTGTANSPRSSGRDGSPSARTAYTARPSRTVSSRTRRITCPSSPAS
ncbi:MAG: glycosyltransferase family 2 protein [Deltaproteobacteria bacterium]|nr:glycosyltransferase family 2 protein [Deltaproteobacteria bacterium]